MIRPITCVTFLLACGSGLYLYQAKHRVHVLDSQIEQVVRETSQVRDQTRVLHATWTLLDQPDRLQQLASQFLALQPTKPTQFVSPADLDSRLPPVSVPQPQATPAEAVPLVASLAPEGAAPAAAPAPPAAPRRASTAVAELPQPAASPARVAEHAVVHASEHPVEAARIVRPTRLAAFETPRPALPRPTPVYQRPAPRRSDYQPAAYQRPRYQSAPGQPAPRYTPQPAPAAPAAGGSMLGMAHAAVPLPAPAPMWINWNSR